ncbi:MAG: hypothetical protein SOH81_07290 [Acetobacter sp.]
MQIMSLPLGKFMERARISSLDRRAVQAQTQGRLLPEIAYHGDFSENCVQKRVKFFYIFLILQAAMEMFRTDYDGVVIFL